MPSLRELWAHLRLAQGTSPGEGYRLQLLDTFRGVRVYAALAETSLAPAVIVEIPEAARPRPGIGAVTRAFEAKLADFTGLAPGRLGIAVVLRDAGFEDLFGTFGEEILATVRGAPSSGEAARAVGRCVSRWRRFVDRGPRRLSEEEIRGLIGELVVLGRCIGRLGAWVAVTGWRGPEGALRDFELPDASVEVKAYQSDSGAAVRISDPQQLDEGGARPVYLAAVRLARVEASGRELPEFVERARSLLEGAPEAVETFEERLASYGYLPIQASSYTDRFVAENVALYRVTPGFPRVRPEDVPAGVVHVHFSIQLTALAGFERDPVAIIGGPSPVIEGVA